MNKSAVMVLSKDVVNSCRKWGKVYIALSIASSYSYLGIDFSSMEPGICTKGSD